MFFVSFSFYTYVYQYDILRSLWLLLEIFSAAVVIGKNNHRKFENEHRSICPKNTIAKHNKSLHMPDISHYFQGYIYTTLHPSPVGMVWKQPFKYCEISITQQLNFNRKLKTKRSKSRRFPGVVGTLNNYETHLVFLSNNTCQYLCLTISMKLTSYSYLTTHTNVCLTIYT